MTPTSAVLATVLAMSITAAASMAQAPEGGRRSADTTLATRIRRYEAWRASNHDIDTRIPRIVAETRDSLAAYRQNAAAGESLADPSRIFRTPGAGVIIWDCAVCPEMIVVPAGVFTMGSPEDEPGRGADEGPRKRVSIPAPLAVSRYEITLGEYEVFLRETGRPVQGNCVTDRAKPGTWSPEPKTTLRDPGFPQAPDHPVVCVSWDDAQAYVTWINARTSGSYRLLTEAEWEFAARAGTTATYPWGPDVNDGCLDANITDATIGAMYPSWTTATCDDRALHTAPVGSYRPNGFGLYDMIGNAQEWVQDCATTSYETLPSDGRADDSGDCSRRVVRSSSWGTLPKDNRVANRVRYPGGLVDDSVGIRVARDLLNRN
jgi:formylglycine-generating enzyme required for sulfatase activity